MKTQIYIEKLRHGDYLVVHGNRTESGRTCYSEPIEALIVPNHRLHHAIPFDTFIDLVDGGKKSITCEIWPETLRWWREQAHIGPTPAIVEPPPPGPTLPEQRYKV